MTSPRPAAPGNALLGLLLGILVLAEAGLAALGALVWSACHRHSITAAEAASFTVLGVSAAAGAVITLLALIAVVRGRHGHRLARAAAGLHFARLLGLVVATVLIAGQLGIAAVAGLTETFALALAGVEVLGALYATTVVARRTRPT
ncbi:hypothetical protein [Actinoplanes palleronii]|uniref:DUF2975 domain-containing protein n=1 Tax=Actinoplanes palleronii TaxID=113570 RepID=A0ABQ4BRM2_9ACTN|nr:hypothetical protein [Actinoplanes palleronii]GIE73326.1 hypothetical protein Apa02nite_094340 [Actinoplanes palleronii]